MTVKELTEKLLLYPEDTEVLLQDDFKEQFVDISDVDYSAVTNAIIIYRED